MRTPNVVTLIHHHFSGELVEFECAWICCYFSATTVVIIQSSKHSHAHAKKYTKQKFVSINRHQNKLRIFLLGAIEEVIKFHWIHLSTTECPVYNSDDDYDGQATISDRQTLFCVVYMKWSQHRLNANKHLIRFRTVVWALCTTDRLCAVYDRSHWLAVAAADVCMRALLCIYVLLFVVHSVSIIFALALLWLGFESSRFTSVSIVFNGYRYTTLVRSSGVCVHEYGCGCAVDTYRSCVFRVAAFTCVRCAVTLLSYTRWLSHWYPHTNLATDFIVSSCAYVLMITCHHNHTQKSCFYGPTLTPASHCVYKVPIAHLTHDDAKASAVCICCVWL